MYKKTILKNVKIAELSYKLTQTYNRVVYGKKYDNLPDWETLTAEQRRPYHQAVSEEITNPRRSNAASHNKWMKDRKSQGWKYGKTLNRAKKIHPDLVPYNELPKSERFKDIHFRMLVKHAQHFDQFRRTKEIKD